MEKKKQNTPKTKGRLFIVCPTLDMLLASCDNIKKAADDGGIEYSNFVKNCKLEKDLRISTYLKCAYALGKDMLIIHLTYGIIDSIVKTRKNISNRCQIVEEKDLLRILRKLYQFDKSQILLHLELFLMSLREQQNEEDLKRSLLSLLKFILKILNQDECDQS